MALRVYCNGCKRPVKVLTGNEQCDSYKDFYCGPDILNCAAKKAKFDDFIQVKYEQTIKAYNTWVENKRLQVFGS